MPTVPAALPAVQARHLPAALLGRDPDVIYGAAARRLVAGRTVLVSGAGGSIGSELARQVHTLGPARLVLLDHDESALHSLQLDLHGHGLFDGDDVVLCDIRDEPTVRQLLAEYRPDIVFHAAAHKHLPLLERFPAEGIKTNVLGTLNLLRAAAAAGAGHFVNISTDKAADPDLGARRRPSGWPSCWSPRTPAAGCGSPRCASATCSAAAARSCTR